MLTLHTYFRSSAAFRVRIALNLKALAYQSVAVHLVRNGGEQLAEAYRALNPDGLVPALTVSATDDMASQQVLTQSLAMIEYLDEQYPAVPLLPVHPLDRAWVRSIALSSACDIHPVNNLRVLRYLTGPLQVSEADKNTWYKHWCEQGLAALETRLARDHRVGQFCFGDTPGMADCCLIPQVMNAQRFNCDLSAMPTILRLHANCMAREEFQRAAPAAQADAE
jgi:maleylacetoacetate isomerase